MDEKLNSSAQEAARKLKDLMKDVSMCLFSTNLQAQQAAVTRPMSAHLSYEDDCIWFLVSTTVIKMQL